VIASSIRGVVDLSHFQGGGTLVDYIGYFVDGSFMFIIYSVPAGELASVAEALGGVGYKAGEEEEEEGFKEHVDLDMFSNRRG